MSNAFNLNSWTAERLQEQDAGGMEFSLWLRKVGLSRATGYRYRRDGKVVTYNIDGIEFILTEDVMRFWRRAKAGEFAKKPRGASAKRNEALRELTARDANDSGKNPARAALASSDLMIGTQKVSPEATINQSKKNDLLKGDEEK